MRLDELERLWALRAEAAAVNHEEMVKVCDRLIAKAADDAVER